MEFLLAALGFLFAYFLRVVWSRRKAVDDPVKAKSILLDKIAKEERKASVLETRAKLHRRIAESKKEKVEKLSDQELTEELKSYLERRKKSKASGPTVFVLCLALSNNVYAQEPMLHPETKVEGHWLSDEDLKILLADALAYEECQKETEALEEAIETRKSELGDYAAVIAATELKLEEAEDKIARSNVWFRSGWFWFSVGLVAGSASVTALVLTTDDGR